MSQGLATEPIEGLMPCSRIVLPSSSERYCDPWSEWCMRPDEGPLLVIAILSASSGLRSFSSAQAHQHVGQSKFGYTKTYTQGTGYRMKKD